MSPVQLSKPPCPICQTAAARSMSCFRRNELNPGAANQFVEDTLWLCDQCGFRWIDPPPDVDALLDAYKTTPYDHWGDPNRGGEGDLRNYTSKINQICEFVPGGKALDVGCFNGDFLSYLPDTFEKWGVEISASAAAHARERGIHVFETDILKAKLPDNEFDLIYCSDVFEHLVDQEQLAQTLANALAPNGVLVIETGDSRSPMARIMGARWYYQGLVEHVCFHSSESLSMLMNSVNLSPLVEERRWHETPSHLGGPIQKATLAISYRIAMDLVGLFRRVLPLPDMIERLYSRTAPRHVWRDHLWHFYQRSAH